MVDRDDIDAPKEGSRGSRHSDRRSRRKVSKISMISPGKFCHNANFVRSLGPDKKSIMKMLKCFRDQKILLS